MKYYIFIAVFLITSIGVVSIGEYMRSPDDRAIIPRIHPNSVSNKLELIIEEVAVETAIAD